MLNRRDILNAARRVGTALLAAPGSLVVASAATSTASAPSNSGSGLFGQVRSVLNSQPVADAQVIIPTLGLQTTADRNGAYVLATPPGNYVVRVTAPGFVAAIRPDQTVREGYTSLTVDLVPYVTSEAEQEALYAKVVRQTESPLVALPSVPLKRQNGSFSLPTNITIFYDSWNPPQYVQVPLEDYVKGVIPNEVPPSWPMETLKAQAVASRSYGVASFLAQRYVYPDSRSQVYDPSKRTSTTDAAVDATAGQVLTYAGNVITAFFFSRCNAVTTRNSEDAISLTWDPGTGLYDCGTSGWNYVPYCRARSCGGHSPSTLSNCGYFGHGVGMCQWGGNYQGSIGITYNAILSSYYTNTTLENSTPGIGSPTPQGPFLVQAGVQFTLSWASAGSGATYNVSLQPSGGGSPVASINGTQNTWWQVGGLALGTYTWTVTAYWSGQSATATATLHVVSQIRRVYVPFSQK